MLALAREYLLAYSLTVVARLWLTQIQDYIGKSDGLCVSRKTPRS